MISQQEFYKFFTSTFSMISFYNEKVAERNSKENNLEVNKNENDILFDENLCVICDERKSNIALECFVSILLSITIVKSV